MTNYYALWIPSYQEEVPTIQRDKLDEVILRDIPGSDTIRLKGEIDRTSFNIHLCYQINKAEWNHLYFICTDRQQTDGFIFYSLEMEDHETETDFVRSRLSENLPKSIYHYFKEFFHIHSLHATGEDSLLPVYHSKESIDWNNDQTRKSVITPIIKAYTDKFDGFYRQPSGNSEIINIYACFRTETTCPINLAVRVNTGKDSYEWLERLMEDLSFCEREALLYITKGKRFESDSFITVQAN